MVLSTRESSGKTAQEARNMNSERLDVLKRRSGFCVHSAMESAEVYLRFSVVRYVMVTCRAALAI